MRRLIGFALLSMGILVLSVSLDLLTTRAVDAANPQAVVVTNTPP